MNPDTLKDAKAFINECRGIKYGPEDAVGLALKFAKALVSLDRAYPPIKFPVGTLVWAVKLCTDCSAHEVVGPARVNYVQVSLYSPKNRYFQSSVSSYCLDGILKHDGFYPEDVFATQKEAQTEADRLNKDYPEGT